MSKPLANESSLTGIRKVDGKWVLEGYDEDCRALALDNGIAKRMRRLRFAESRLLMARDALSAYQTLPKETDISLKEAAIAGAVTFYFSVFKEGDYSPMLDPNVVFKGNPDTLARHYDWLSMRDTKLVHPGELMATMGSVLVVNQSDEFVDFAVVKMDLPLSSEHGWLQILYQLIHEALGHVDAAAEKAFQRIKRDVEKMSSTQIQELNPGSLQTPRKV